MQEVATGKYHGHNFGGLNGVPTAYSGLMFANLMTFAHLSVSLAISRPKSAGDPGNTVLPSAASCAFIFGSASARLVSVFIISTISAGVLLGAPSPVSRLASKRSGEVTANACSLPALTYSIAGGMVEKSTCTWPLRRSASAGAWPRYGTCTMLTPDIILNNSPDM